jgi:hypothetical protein
MKTINNEIKSKIFAPYYKQKVLIHTKAKSLEGYPFVLHSLLEKDIDNYSLWLTSLENITDKDAIEVAILLGYDREYHDKINLGKKFLNEIFLNNSSYLYSSILLCFQYLQSKGYALPYMSYSVENLVKLRVYKLK